MDLSQYTTIPLPIHHGVIPKEANPEKPTHDLVSVSLISFAMFLFGRAQFFSHDLCLPFWADALALNILDWFSVVCDVIFYEGGEY